MIKLYRDVGHNSTHARWAKVVPRKMATVVPKPSKARGKPSEIANKQLAEQIRKDLRKHYASKYRVR